MARSFSTEQDDILNSAKYDVYTRLEIEDSTGAFVDINTIGGANWFESARWDWSLDEPVPEITLKVRRDQGPSTGESLAPLDEDSTFNRDAAASFAALVDVGREIRFYTATRAAGSAAPATSELDWVFQGEIDDVKWPKSPLEIVARSKIMSRINDQWVETVTIYGSDSGVAIETVMQSILDDHTDLGITLSVPVSPGFLISPAYEQQKASVLDALTTLAQLIGWQIREVFSSTDWVLELSEPRRTATSSETDWIFGANDYYDVKDMSISRVDVRNAISIIYGQSSDRKKELTESTGSIDLFGRRWMEIEEDTNSSIDSSSEAGTLADSILSDLDTPPASHSIEVPYWWPGELGDYYEFESNEIHYSVDQFLGVYGLSHNLERDTHRTSIRVRGQPAGQYLQWQNYPGGGGTPADLTVRFVSERTRSIASTVDGVQQFERDIEIQAGQDARSIIIEYSFIRPRTANDQPPPSDTISADYFINTTGGDPLTHTLQTAGSSNSGGVSIFIYQDNSTKFGASAATSAAGSPIKDSNFFLFATPYSEAGGSSGGGIAGRQQSILVGILASNDDVGVRVVSSSGDELPGHGLSPGSTNVQFELGAGGLLLLTVTT